MPKYLPHTDEQAIADLVTRVRELERHAGRNARPQTVEIAPFSGDGPVAVTPAGDEPQWNVYVGGQIVSVSAHLKTAGSSDTVITFYLNGVSIGTITLASSETDKVAYLGDHRAKNGDKISSRITTAGTGAKGPSAFVVMKG